MSTGNPPQGETVRPAPAPPPPPEQDSVTVISHSNIFYWWPVWAVGFLMAIWTLWIDGFYMVTVPANSEILSGATVIKKTEGEKRELDNRTAVILPEGKELPALAKGTKHSLVVGKDRGAGVHMARNKNLGVLFCMTLLLVVTITNVPLRGMWSVVVIIVVILFSVIFALAGWWEAIVTTLSLLDIRINAGGYAFISSVLLAIWVIAVFFFDRQTYIVFTPGQFKVCQEIGGGEKVYDVVGLTLERQRGDIFRHYILGLGSGDLVVKTTGAQAHHFDLPNVLFISKKVQMIEDVIRKRKVETGS
jgi:hypothetical protein